MIDEIGDGNGKGGNSTRELKWETAHERRGRHGPTEIA